MRKPESKLKMNDPPNHTPHRVPATGSVTLRALSLLESFLPGSSRLTLSDMASSSGLPLSTAHRLAKDLVTWGALNREPDGRYVIGSRLRQIAGNAPHGTLLRETCLPHLEDLADLTKQTALLAILNGTQVAYLEQARGEDSSFRPALQEPAALSTAAGRLLGAFAPAYVQEAMLARHFDQLTVHTTTSRDALREKLSEARRQNYAVADKEIDTRDTVIAAPIRDSGGRYLAAIVLIIPSDSSKKETYIQLCIAAGRAAGRSLAATTV